MRLVRFMSTPAGRGLRVALGLVAIAAGVALGGPGGGALAVFGLLPLVTGAADICPICPLLGEERRGRAGCKGTTCS